MSFLPRVERPYTDFYPNLDLDAVVEVAWDSPEEPEVNGNATAVLKDTPNQKNTDAERTNKAASSSQYGEQDKAIAVPEQSYSQFNVSGLIGGINTGPRFKPLRHSLPTPAPAIRNAAVARAKLGYFEPGKSWNPAHAVRPDASMDVYRPFLTILPQDPLDLEKHITELTHVEYDIDEADLGVLGFLSLRFGELMEPEVFEVVMSMLDLAAALICLKMFPQQREAGLQHSTSPVMASTGLSVGPSAGSHVCPGPGHPGSEHAVGNGNGSPGSKVTTSADNGTAVANGASTIDGLHTEENRRCAVCNWTECTDSNTIVFCDGCDVAVHQDCYGVHSIPEGRWLCRRCESEGIGAEVDCILCPRKSGAFKKTAEDKWIHLVCALWTPIVRVPEDSSLLEPIVDAEHVERERWDLNCYVCRQKEGACIQCAARDCFQAFHPTCAQAAGFYMTNYNHDIGDMLHHQEYLPVYCHRHSLAHAPRNTPPPSLEFARKLLAEERARQNAPGVSLFAMRHHKYWRTANGTLILPQAVVEAVIVSLKRRLGLDLRREVVQFLCRYWTIKKDSLDGVMFGRRLHQALEIAQHRVMRAEQSEEPAKQPGELIRIVDELLAVLHPRSPKSQIAGSITKKRPPSRLKKRGATDIKTRRAEAATRLPRKSRRL